MSAAARMNACGKQPGPWMALVFAPAHPFGPASAYATAGRKPAAAGEATLACLACGKQPGPWMARLGYFLIRSRTVMPLGIIGSTCSW